MRKTNFSRKLHSILSITLSLVMLIGACFAVPATTAVAEGETITIDFENNVYGGGSGLLGTVATTGSDGEATTAFKIMGHNTNSGHYRSKSVLDANGQQYTLTAGDWQMTYDYIVPAETSVKAYLIYDFGIQTGVLCADTGTYCSGAKVMDENLIASYDVGVWKSNTINFTIDQDKTYLGFAGIGLAPEVYIDNVVFTKLADKEPEVAIGPYAEEHDAFTTYGNYKNDVGSKDTMDANNMQISGNVFNYRNTLFANTFVEENSVLAVALWTGARHMRLNDTAQGLALRAGKAYSLTFKWLNPNPEKDGVVGNESINNGTSAYDEGAYVSLVANAGAFNGTGYSTLVTLLNVNDFSSAEGNTGEFVTKTVTFTTPAGADITDIAISTKSSDGPSADTSKLNQNWIFLDDIQFTCDGEATVEPITIDFEDETLNGSGYFGIDSVTGANGTDTTKAFRARYVSESARYAQIMQNGAIISLPEGTYKFEYSYFISADATDYTDKSSVKFAETNGLKSPWDNGSTIGVNVILSGSQKGVWIKSSQYIDLPSGVTALGIFATKNPTNIYLDDIKVTKVEGFAKFEYSDGTVEELEYTDTLTIPEDKAVNFSHWVNSKGQTAQAGAAVENNETYTAVVNDSFTYDFTNFKETDAAKKTEDGICVTVEKLTDNFVEVPLVNEDGKFVALNKNTGYFVRATYKSMSAEGEDGTGKAGYIREWSNEEKKTAANGNWPEMRFSKSANEYFLGGIPFADKENFGTSGWTYIETADSVALKVKLSAREADLENIYLKSIEFIPVNLDDIKPTIGVELLYNGTDSEVTLSSKKANSNLNGLKMPAMSAVYNYNDTQRSLIRFVGNYNYGTTTQTLKINDEVSVEIFNRRIRVARDGYATGANGFITNAAAALVGQTAEVGGNDLLNYWRKDDSSVDYSIALKNISEAKKDTTYHAQTYLNLEVVNGNNANSWNAESANYNYLFVRSDIISVSATQIYNALAAENAGIAWYTESTAE